MRDVSEGGDGEGDGDGEGEERVLHEKSANFKVL